MEMLRTEQTIFTADEISDAITKYQSTTVPVLDRRWEYYQGKNTKILSRPKGDANNPDERIAVPYGRKIIKTFVGYAFRPGYTTYKLDEGDEAYLDELWRIFKASKEHIRTSRAGRNAAIFGVAYEMMYLEQSEPRFFEVDPREVVLFYDYAPEPKKVLGIRYYTITPKLMKVEVWYPDRVEYYDRTRRDESDYTTEKTWIMSLTDTQPNFFQAVPIPAYYFGDERMGLIEHVIPLIDAYDTLTSDSINEFERFAHAYMLLVKMHLVSPELKKEPGAFSNALRRLRELRIFENLPDKDAVSFLTKEIPKEFIEYMMQTLQSQIHEQSHVPNFAKLIGELSGAAIERLMFDFENVVSSSEADFDTGLRERIELINAILSVTGRPVDDPDNVIISHKRNMPLNLNEFSKTALTLKQAGFSRYLVADIMPDDVVPDVDVELQRQDEDLASMMPDIDNTPADEIEE